MKKAENAAILKLYCHVILDNIGRVGWGKKNCLGMSGRARRISKTAEVEPLSAEVRTAYYPFYVESAEISAFS